MKVTGLDRIGIDKFYTKKEVAQKCCDIINENKLIKENDMIIEPSSGNGSFIDSIKKISNNYKFYDIDPQHNEIIQMDFLTLEISEKENIHIIGNPPFGRQSSLAKKFIKKCSVFAKTISFILPKSFKKESYQKTFPLNFHLIHEHNIPKNSFIINEKDHDVPCVFQIWERKLYYRNISIKEEPLGFIFVKKEDNPDISFRRVGFYAGEIDTNIQNKSITSHYFIKFLNFELLILLNSFKNINFPENNTVGAKSISKPELIREFNAIIKSQ